MKTAVDVSRELPVPVVVVTVSVDTHWVNSDAMAAVLLKESDVREDKCVTFEVIRGVFSGVLVDDFLLSVLVVHS